MEKREYSFGGMPWSDEQARLFHQANGGGHFYDTREYDSLLSSLEDFQRQKKCKLGEQIYNPHEFNPHEFRSWFLALENARCHKRKRTTNPQSDTLEEEENKRARKSSNKPLDSDLKRELGSKLWPSIERNQYKEEPDWSSWKNRQMYGLNSIVKDAGIKNYIKDNMPADGDLTDIIRLLKEKSLIPEALTRNYHDDDNANTPANEKQKHIKRLLQQKILDARLKDEKYNDDNMPADAQTTHQTQNLLIETRLKAMTHYAQSP